MASVRRKPLAVLGAGIVLLLAACILWGLGAPHRDRFIEAIHRRGYPASPAELEAWYLPVPPAENVALAYTNAIARLTDSGPITNFTSKSWLPPIGQGLSADEISDLKAALAEYHETLRLVYAVPASGRSRYPIRLADGPATQLPHLFKIKQASCLLSAEGLLHATEGDPERATQAFLAAGRLTESLSEEPTIISQLVRYADWAILLPRLERGLSLTRFTDAQLASLQELIAAAERPKSALRGIIGERAINISVFTDRKMALDALIELRGAPGNAQRLLMGGGLTLLRVTGLLEKDEAYFCDYMGKQVAALELPYPERFAACQQAARMTNMPGHMLVFSSLLLPALGRYFSREADHVALVRVAVTALGVERFRLAHTNALPGALAQLVPSCCPTLPSDPIDGKPLHYKTHGASYAVYGVGNDGQDDGGVAWDSNFIKIPQDVGFVVKH